jgi:hypothetical protein
MTKKQIRSVALVACVVAAFSPVAAPYAQAKQQCNLAMPSDLRSGWWSYRIIDGRKCWYKGKPGLSKSLLEWPSETSSRPSSNEELARAAPTKNFGKLLDAEASAPTDLVTFDVLWRDRVEQR